MMSVVHGHRRLVHANGSDCPPFPFGVCVLKNLRVAVQIAEGAISTKKVDWSEDFKVVVTKSLLDYLQSDPLMIQVCTCGWILQFFPPFSCVCVYIFCRHVSVCTCTCT